MIMVFVLIDLGFAVGFLTGILWMIYLDKKSCSSNTSGTNIPQQPSVPPMPGKLQTYTLDEGNKIEIISECCSMNSAREYIGIPEMPKKEEY